MSTQFLLYDSLSQQKKPLSIYSEDILKIYVCGITVYDDCHIGHARVSYVFDALIRYIRSKGKKVCYVRNVTDIDDKIIARAEREGVAPSVISERFLKSMHEDFINLGIQVPDFEPKATDNLEEISDFIQQLLDVSVAYRTDKGDILFSIEKFADYGKLSKKKIEELLPGARIAIDVVKKHPGDFALWKRVETSSFGYQSQFGYGRPGWHIECSTMARCLLGDTLDIHGGGNDLQFPHHENEIAQSESISKCTLAKHWVHVGFVTIKDEKMSKSLGNTVSIKDALANYRADALRYFFLSSHYRSPVRYHQQALDNAVMRLTKVQTALTYACNKTTTITHALQDEFHKHLQNDFNTPNALAVLQKLAHWVHVSHADGAQEKRDDYANLLRELCQSIGLFIETNNSMEISKIETLLETRAKYREKGDFTKSDEIRDQLLTKGIVIDDGPSGTTWRHKL